MPTAEVRDASASDVRDLELKGEWLSGKFRQIAVWLGLHKAGVSEEKVAEAAERALDIFDLTRSTLGRRRCLER